MPRLIFLAVLTLASLAPSATSAQMLAQEILWNCDTPSGDAPIEQYGHHFRCIGYIQGAHDMLAYLMTYGGAQTDLYCTPTKGISIDQLRRILIKWIKANPEAMHLTARQVIVSALIETFPCKKQAESPSAAMPPPPRARE